jgi:NTP pyrophosphatase (non-canonical NTP hydrolase)
MNFEETHRKVIKWGEDRDILFGATTEAQLLKLVEEHQELHDGFFNADIDEIKDALGDMLVVMTFVAALNGLTIQECYESAYNEIKDRKGKLVNGIFEKED